ncbi:hypothetical protein C8J48_1805 [Desmospora activa DSM 45169]|uniref:Uncharacterized protein n=1 Tax=Desmospora activa DSM 45169 TaxID=1121389 RepID=A0A2T4ZBD1_9BACL|nr:hypothetical protein C8J48_1805 [Desmospora activa DSM 45169]
MNQHPYFLEQYQKERKRTLEAYLREPRHFRPSLFHRIRKGLERMLRRPQTLKCRIKNGI